MRLPLAVHDRRPPDAYKAEEVAMSGRPARRPGQTLTCGWCGREFALAARGRTPKWCSQSCRQRAWEQRRAAESARAAVDVVVRTVEVEKPVTVRVVQRVEVPVALTGRAWLGVLAELVDQIDRGRIYDRDLAEVAVAVDDVLRALHRRPAFQRVLRRSHRF